MTKPAVRLLRDCIVQLIVTEGVSFWLFWRTRDITGPPIVTGLIAPVLLPVVPPWLSLEQGHYIGFAVFVLADLVFLGFMAFLIANNRRVASRLCLLVLNVVGILIMGGGA